MSWLVRAAGLGAASWGDAANAGVMATTSDVTTRADFAWNMSSLVSNWPDNSTEIRFQRWKTVLKSFSFNKEITKHHKIYGFSITTPLTHAFSHIAHGKPVVSYPNADLTFCCDHSFAVRTTKCRQRENAHGHLVSRILLQQVKEFWGSITAMLKRHYITEFPEKVC